ncbi:MAG: GPW/gp25 family protein [Opitutae bacterium]|nr:GPW/gp25 family protein [Opitutae bacterium]
MSAPLEHWPQDSAFLGRGWAFPPTFDVDTGQARLVQGEEDIRQSIHLILGMAPGERQMLPKFGCDLTQFVFGAVDTSVKTMIATLVQRALLDYEPRINVTAVDVALENDSARSAILVGIDYVVRATNRRYNLVYPYYVHEGSGTIA